MIKINFFSIIFIAVMLFPVIVYGQYFEIPCDGPDCTFGDLVKLASNLLEFMIILAVLLSAIVFAWAGFIYVTAGGDQSKISKAHNVFKLVGLGLLIILAAWLMIDLILTALTERGGVEDWDPNNQEVSYLLLDI